MQKPFILSSCLFTNNETANPFSKFHIDSSEFLDSVEARGECPKCGKSRKYFCYTCYVILDDVKHKVPQLKERNARGAYGQSAGPSFQGRHSRHQDFANEPRKVGGESSLLCPSGTELPVKIDVIKHPSEVAGKCTSTHAAILAPEEVNIFTFPDIPDYTNQNVVMAFPSKNAVSLSEYWKMFQGQNASLCSSSMREEKDLMENCQKLPSRQTGDRELNLKNNSSEEILSNDWNSCKSLLPFDKVVFIDSTWRQTKQLCRDERLKNLPCVVLNSHKSLFWRHQRDKPLSYLATVEAIYYFLVELDQLMHPDVPYQGKYDNMLFFFKYMYQKIRKFYDPRVLSSFNSDNNPFE